MAGELPRQNMMINQIKCFSEVKEYNASINPLGIGFFYSTVNWIAEGEQICKLYSTEMLSDTETIRHSTEIEIDFFTWNCTTKKTEIVGDIAAISFKQPNKLSRLQNIQLNLITVTLVAI